MLEVEQRQKRSVNSRNLIDLVCPRSRTDRVKWGQLAVINPRREPSPIERLNL